MSKHEAAPAADALKAARSDLESVHSLTTMAFHLFGIAEEKSAILEGDKFQLYTQAAEKLDAVYSALDIVNIDWPRQFHNSHYREVNELSGLVMQARDLFSLLARLEGVITEGEMESLCTLCMNLPWQIICDIDEIAEKLKDGEGGKRS